MPKPSKAAANTAKMLAYALGTRPDEFGLVPDPDGYVPVKHLLKALNQEEGWRHLRVAHLKEVALTVVPCPVDLEKDRIRAINRNGLPRPEIPRELPKLLYAAVRRRAYPHVHDKGLRAGAGSRLVLSSDREMALKLGLRIDNEPVILCVQVMKSVDAGVDYKRYGETLFLTDAILPDTFSGPPLPKEKPGRGKPEVVQPKPRNETPGSYFPDFTAGLPDPADTAREKKKRRKKAAEWKKARKQARRHKNRLQGS
jgi:putative RNA 2'-phosphotransferase